TIAESSLGADEIVRLCRDHTIFSWSAQARVDPIVIDRAEGIYFWDPNGKRYIDFNSQLMSVNIGHGNRRVADAIAAQAHRLAFAAPQFATEVRGRLGQMLAELTPGDLNHFFFTLGGAEANENALRMARLFTGRQKVMARYRSYHGATAGAISVTGDPRRWASEPAVPGVIRVLDPYRWGDPEPQPVDEQLAYLEEVINYEGPQTIAAFILETVTGTNGILVPPDGYLQGVRELCTKYGIVMICDEVMAGFGRTGRWFAVDHWNVVPDLMTMAKGLTSSYLPLGAVAVSDRIAAHFAENVYYGGLTYSAHPVSCAAAIAAIEVLRDEDLVGNAARLDPLLRELLRGLEARHPSVGATRSIGLFGIVELVRSRDPWVPLGAYNQTPPEVAALDRRLKANGLYTMTHWNAFFTNPPLCITEEQLREAFAIIDAALEETDAAVTG
ncbi:MAG TPA: aminotransferase class III-fold pyridoxal phosphate-dependent enzyme, partial [Candidatus Limnocylindria bacterium]|nr:aminotransferase class III-fold pyridoxal phosphate-dependent enzyme [Candidatus Limnocylindria bacterium]